MADERQASRYSDSHIRLPPWLPVSAMVLILAAGVVGIVALTYNQ